MFIATAIAGCATPPAQHAFIKSNTYDQNFETTWTHLLQFFTSNNIQIKTIEKASGVVYAERLFVDGYNVYADCGTPGLAAILNTTGSLNVFVVANGKTTTVTVNTTFNQVRQYEANIWTVACTSTGVLEQQILSAM
jgi:hypothetical protein